MKNKTNQPKRGDRSLLGDLFYGPLGPVVITFLFAEAFTLVGCGQQTNSNNPEQEDAYSYFYNLGNPNKPDFGEIEAPLGTYVIRKATETEADAINRWIGKHPEEQIVSMAGIPNPSAPNSTAGAQEINGDGLRGILITHRPYRDHLLEKDETQKKQTQNAILISDFTQSIPKAAIITTIPTTNGGGFRAILCVTDGPGATKPSKTPISGE